MFGVVWGIVICILLFSTSLKAGKGMWLVMVPAILIIVALGANFAGHMLHLPRPIFPHQKQIIDAINWALLAAALPVSLGEKGDAKHLVSLFFSFQAEFLVWAVQMKIFAP